MAYLIGLTGLIGSGKSLVGQMFADLGIKIIDTDIIAHQLTLPNNGGFNAIIKTFGSHYISDSGQLNRSLLREEVFSDAASLSKLEGILHPMIFNEVQQQLSELSDKNDLYIIIVVPLLFKSPRYLQLVNRTLVVDCDQEILIERVSRRSSISRPQVLEILARQLPRHQQLMMADDIIRNEGSTVQLYDQVKFYHGKYSIYAKHNLGC
jgi:dephospho-CoA kinase